MAVAVLAGSFAGRQFRSTPRGIHRTSIAEAGRAPTRTRRLLLAASFSFTICSIPSGEPPTVQAEACATFEKSQLGSAGDGHRFAELSVQVIRISGRIFLQIEMNAPPSL